MADRSAQLSIAFFAVTLLLLGLPASPAQALPSEIQFPSGAG